MLWYGFIISLGCIVVKLFFLVVGVHFWWGQECPFQNNIHGFGLTP